MRDSRRHTILPLAPIVGGEVRLGPARPSVSAVYPNRLDRGMRLQADPTVIYALGHRRRLYEKDYATRSRYNTYLISGLPPTPINQPSAADVEAALYPAHTNLLYRVARPDGKHIFSRTLREHLEAVGAPVPVGGEVFPFAVHSGDQPELLFSPPVL